MKSFSRVVIVCCSIAMILVALRAEGFTQSADSWGIGELSPMCGGGAYASNLTSANQVQDLASTPLSAATTYPLLDCFSYLRTGYYEPPTQALNTPENEEACAVSASKTKLDLQYIRSYDNHILATVPLDQIFGDSIQGTAVPIFNASVYLRVTATSPADLLPDCTINVKYSFPSGVFVLPIAVVDENVPRLMDLSPFVAESGVKQQFHFARPRVSGLAAGPSATTVDRFFIASMNEGCLLGPLYGLDNSAKATEYRDPVPGVDRDVDPGNEVVGTWEFTFNSHGTYFICMIPANWGIKFLYGFPIFALELGMVTVFGGNPAFYAIEGYSDQSQGLLELNRPYTFVITGYGLDLRPGGDQAKIIDPSFWCDCTCSPSLGVSLTTDLGPTDDFGHNVSLARWEVTFSQSGSFWLCYKRKGSPAFVRVFPIHHVSQGGQEFLGNLSHLEARHGDETFAPPPPTSAPTPIPTTTTVSPPTPAPPTPVGQTTTTTTASPTTISTMAPSTTTFAPSESSYPLTTTTTTSTEPAGTQPPLSTAVFVTDTVAPGSEEPSRLATPSPVPTTTLPPAQTFTEAPPPPTTAAPPGETAAPTTAVPCLPQAPEFNATEARNNPAGDYVSLEISSNQDVNSELAISLAEVLCVPVGYLLFQGPFRDKGTDKWYVQVTVTCVSQCNSGDKMNYLAWLFSLNAINSKEKGGALTALQTAGVITGASAARADPQNSIQVAEPADNQGGGVSNLLAIVLAGFALLFVLIVVIIVIVVNRRRKKKQQHRNFNPAVNAAAQNDPHLTDAAATRTPTRTEGDIEIEDDVEVEVEIEIDDSSPGSPDAFVRRQSGGGPGKAWLPSEDIDMTAKPSM